MATPWDGRNGVERGLQGLTAGVQSMVESVVTDHSISAPDLRRVLRFLAKVVEVVDQAFRDVYAVLIEFKFLSAADIESGRLWDLRKELDGLRARDRYRDAELICGRLHTLDAQFRQEISGIVFPLFSAPGSVNWQSVFHLLDEHEGRIIQLVHEAIRQLERMLNGPLDEIALASIRQTAAEKGDAIRESLVQLQALESRILGMSGAPGFLELTEIDRHSLVAEVTSIRAQEVVYVNRAINSEIRDFMQGGGRVPSARSEETMGETHSPRTDPLSAAGGENLMAENAHPTKFVASGTGAQIVYNERVWNSTLQNFMNNYITSDGSTEDQANKQLAELIELIRDSKDLPPEEKTEAVQALDTVGGIVKEKKAQENKVVVKGTLEQVKNIVSKAGDIAGKGAQIIGAVLGLLALL